MCVKHWLIQKANLLYEKELTSQNHPESPAWFLKTELVLPPQPVDSLIQCCYSMLHIYNQTGTAAFAGTVLPSTCHIEGNSNELADCPRR